MWMLLQNEMLQWKNFYFTRKLMGLVLIVKNINDYHCMYQSTLNVDFKPLLINTHIHVLLF